MEYFNKNNPTQGWTDDEKYDFCKIENKWLKELAKNRKTNYGVAANDPVFSSVEEINAAFQNDIFRRKEIWKHLCHICDYATNSKQTLTQHLAVHGIGERFKCDKCDQNFSRKSYLKKHRETHNASSVINKCNHCGKISKTVECLKLHIKMVHSEKRIKCDECEKMFSTDWKLNNHKKQVHVLKSFKCDQCKYRTKTKENLKYHIKTIHDGIRNNCGKCNLCDFQGSSSHLKQHKKSVHENKKNWFCKACSYSTYFKHSFQRHMRTHTGEKPYQCKTCHKGFKRLVSANAHCKNK